MFGSSRQFGLRTISRRNFLTSHYNNRPTRCLSMWNQRSLSKENSETLKEFENGTSRPWASTRITTGISYHRHEGQVPLIESTAGKMLEKAVENWADRECIVSTHQGVRMTYREVLRRVDKMAAGLLKLGLERGDRIGLWGPNDFEWYISFMAISRAGFIMVGINPAYQQSEIDYCLQKVDARAAIAPKTFKTQNYADMLIRARENCPNLKHIVIYSEDHVTGTRRFVDVESLANNTEVQAVAAMQNEISPYDGCNIQFTSGTTGRPKATLLSHRSFVNNSRQTAERLALGDDHHKICLNVPFFHAFGMTAGVFASLHCGSTLVLEGRSYNPKNAVDAILREKCTVTFGTPTMWINLLDVHEKLQASIVSLDRGVTGGATISPDIMKRIREQLHVEGIQSIYGLTELTAVAFQSLPGEPTELTDNTVGHLSDHTEAMVVDQNGFPVPIGTPGELWIRGYSTMKEYWDDEVNTKKSKTEDGWFKTGDQFVLRPDGYGHVVGRLKEIIIRGGENIFPKEIEAFLETHPDVLEAHAFGVHDDVYGDEICACVRLSEDSKLTAKDLRAFGKHKIAHFKIPRYIEIVENYPRTASGKVHKLKMREELENRGVVPKRPGNK